MTDLREESAFGPGRNASAVWPRPVTVKRLSSFRPGGQERPGLAEAAGLLGRFRLTRLRGCWREEDRPRAPQTVVGGRARGLGSTARGLLSRERLLPRHRGGGSRLVP